LKEAKEALINKGDDLSKMQALDEVLIKDVKNTKQRNMIKCKNDKDDSKEELKKKDEQIYGLQNHNQTLLDEVNIFKEEKNHFQK
jgi:hypothetical protein